MVLGAAIAIWGGLVGITVASIALHDQIVDWLKPFGDKVKA